MSTQTLIQFQRLKRGKHKWNSSEKEKKAKHEDSLSSDNSDCSRGVSSQQQQKFDNETLGMWFISYCVCLLSNNTRKAETRFTSLLDRQVFDAAAPETSLRRWNLPESVVKWFEDRGIENMFPWQAECLQYCKILEGRNLVLSAPTSAGKTLISDILLLKKAMETNKKSLLILPFVSVTREKMLTLQSMLRGSRIRVGGFMGGSQPPGGFAAIQIAVCTIEKANSLINKLIEEKRINQLTTVIVDELHLLGDDSRGFILELILAKLSFLSKRKNIKIQVLGMSATLPGVEKFSKWLNAEFYSTTFRPVTLTERLKIGKDLFTSSLSVREEFVKKYKIASDVDDIIHLTFDTIINDNGILIFCASRKACELLAKKIADSIKHFGQKDNTEEPCLKAGLRNVLNRSKIKQILKQLERLSVGLDQSLCEVLMFGVAYHHAGLTIEERDVIEDGFRKGGIKALVATSTLCSGVNLPARRVIIHSPLTFRGHGKQMMDISTYKQMIGRAGRKGIDTEGESFLICNEAEKEVGERLFTAELNDVKSCLFVEVNDINAVSPRLVKAILEVITLGIVTTISDVLDYLSHTFLAQECKDFENVSQLLVKKILAILEEFKFIEKCQEKYFSTRLGVAVVFSSINPMDGLYFVEELDKASGGFILKNDLHILYQVIPPYLSYNLDPEHWEIFGRIWDQLDVDSRKVGSAVGIDQKLITAGFNNTGKKMEEMFRKEQLTNHYRFYSALALNDVIQEMPLNEVTVKYKISKGQLQSMQHNVGTFASMISVFCNKLGWKNLETLIDQFHGRLHFGIQKELIDLMKISCLNAGLARCLYESGFDTIASIAQSNFERIRDALRTFKPFKSSEKESKVWIAGQSRAMNVQEITTETLVEARNIIEKSLGKVIQWQHFDCSIHEDDDNSNGKTKNSHSKEECGATVFAVNGSDISTNDEKSEFSVMKSKSVGNDLTSVFAVKLFNVTQEDEHFHMFSESMRNNSTFSFLFDSEYCSFKTFSSDLITEEQNFRGLCLPSECLVLNRVIFHFENAFLFEGEKALKLLSDHLKYFIGDLKHIRVFDVMLAYKVFRHCFGFTKKIISLIRWLDPKVGDWLLDPEQQEPKSVETLVTKRFPQLKFFRTEALKTQKTIVVDCLCLTYLVENIKQQLDHIKLLSTFEECEIPALVNFAEMEIVGIGVEYNYINKERDRYVKFLDELKLSAFQHAKHPFDLNSPKEIARVLYSEKDLLSKAFDLLVTNRIRKHKRNGKLELSSNLKTAKSVLEKLSKVDELPGVILKWRRLHGAIHKSLDSVASRVYFDKASEMYRVSGKCDYWTLTGRICMSNPNLLGIERDFDASLSLDNSRIVSLRKAFIAQSAHKLISADFQQLELRILAHFSEDQKLITEFNEGKDIFKIVAANICDKEVDAVTSEDRQQAKGICYGIIYGLGRHELSRKLGVIEEAADEFKEKFFATYPHIQKFKEDTISFCQSEGFVESIGNRRRYLPQINHRVNSLKMKAERQAFNTRIQGSASFIVKKFLTKVDNEIMKQELDAKLVLAIHDELLYEVSDSCVHHLRTLLVDCSRSIGLNLRVDLPLKFKVGVNWADMDELCM